MKEWLHEPLNVYAVSFVLFWVLVYVVIRKPALQWLDGEIAKIGAELTTARSLRAEAEAALTECKTKQAQAEKEAAMILEMAKSQAEEMRKRAEADMAATIARQQSMSAERIRMAEEKAISAVRNEAVRLGMEIARKKLSESLSGNNADKLIDSAIDDVQLLKTATKHS